MNFDELLDEWKQAEFEVSQTHEDARAALHEYHENQAEATRRKVEEALRARDAAKARVEHIVGCVFGTHRARDCEMCNCVNTGPHAQPRRS